MFEACLGLQLEGNSAHLWWIIKTHTSKLSPSIQEVMYLHVCSNFQQMYVQSLWLVWCIYGWVMHICLVIHSHCWAHAVIIYTFCCLVEALHVGILNTLWYADAPMEPVYMHFCEQQLQKECARVLYVSLVGENLLSAYMLCKYISSYLMATALPL